MLQCPTDRLASGHKVPTVLPVRQAAILVHSIILLTLQQVLGQLKARTELLLSHLEASVASHCQG